MTQHLVASACEVILWHCKHPHGLFSMFSLALGHMETCEKMGAALLVDWSLVWKEDKKGLAKSWPQLRSSEELLYRGPPGEPNVLALHRSDT